MTPATLLAAMTLLLREEKSSRRDIEALERRVMRNVVKEVFSLSYECLPLRTDVSQQLPRPKAHICSLSEESCRLKILSLEASDRLNFAERFHQQLTGDKSTIALQETKKHALISPSFLDGEASHFSVSNDGLHDESSAVMPWFCGRSPQHDARPHCPFLSFDCDETVRPEDSISNGIFLSVVDCSAASDEEYFSAALGATVHRDLSVTPMNAPHDRRMVFGVQEEKRNASKRFTGPLVLHGRLLRGDVVALINGVRVWTAREVRAWERRMFPSETQYVTLMRQGRKIHVRIGLE